MLLARLIQKFHFLNCNKINTLCCFQGPPDPSKTIFVRHSSTVVCTADIPHVLSIEPRDEFNNICMFQPGDNPTSGYTVDISEVCPGFCLIFSFYQFAPCRLDVDGTCLTWPVWTTTPPVKEFVSKFCSPPRVVTTRQSPTMELFSTTEILISSF